MIKISKIKINIDNDDDDDDDSMMVMMMTTTTSTTKTMMMMMMISCLNKGRNCLLVSCNWNRYRGVQAQAMTGILVLCAHIVFFYPKYTRNAWRSSNC